MKVEQRSSRGACVGIVAGVGLMLFAGALVASTQYGEEIDAFSQALRGRRLEVNITSQLQAATVAGATTVSVVSTEGFVVGQSVMVDPGASQELNRVREITAAVAPLVGGVLTLKHPLTLAHVAGAVIAVQEDSIHKQVLHQISSGSSGFLKSFDTSSGSSTASLSNSMESSESGSSENNIAKAGTATGAGGGAGVWFMQMLFFLCYGFMYKKRVVDPQGIMPKQTLQYDNADDFRYGICDCVKDCNMCMMVTCCAPIRMAHTNATADVCGFWETLLCLGCSSLCMVGPCCLSVYFRIHVKDHMGIQDHCFNDLCLAWCCLPCITGQQALAVDEVMGFSFKCPCTLERSGMGGMGGMGGMEQQALNWS